MSTWHQDQRRVNYYHSTQWTVLIDPPNQPAAVMRFDTKALAEIYLRNLKANNPRIATHAILLKPASK